MNQAELSNDWGPILAEEMQLPYFRRLRNFIIEEYLNEIVYPEQNDIFSAFNLTSFAQTKVVIIGQDPYHSPGQAHGLSFSVKPGVKTPPSLRNIYKELIEDIGCAYPHNGDLRPWAQQGVFLLNTVLTVRENSPNSHKGQGWEEFTDKVIKLLNDKATPLVFILWGKQAEAKSVFITEERHYIIKSPHPSPFAARKGFFGSKPFSRTNELMRKLGFQEIDWELES
jgi:uracil-DNA glycosylase